jgi:hypothetical protein
MYILSNTLNKSLFITSTSKHQAFYASSIKNVFLNFFSDHKSIDAGKQLRYAEHYYEYSHEKLGRKNQNSSNGYNIKKHKKIPTYNDLIIAYASRYKARLNYLYIIYR